MRNKAYLKTMLMMCMMGDSLGNLKPTESLEEYNRKIERKKKDNIHNLSKNKGLTRFDYGENFIYALNKKNADKKASKKGYI